MTDSYITAEQADAFYKELTAMTLIERIARAMYAVDWPEMYHADWDDTAEDMRQRYFILAQAALEAMLEGLTEMDRPAARVTRNFIKAAIAER